MPEYLATVRHPDGRRVTENVVADSADEAVRLLRERGHDEVMLHSDDVGALFIRQRKGRSPFACRLPSISRPAGPPGLLCGGQPTGIP